VKHKAPKKKRGAARTAARTAATKARGDTAPADSKLITRSPKAAHGHGAGPKHHPQAIPSAPVKQEAAPTTKLHATSSATPREEMERQLAEYGRIVAMLRERYWFRDDVARVREKLGDTLEWLRLVRDGIHENASIQDRANSLVAIDAKSAVRGLLQATLDQLLGAAECEGGGVDEECANIVIDVLLDALNRIFGLNRRRRGQTLLRKIARSRIEFPSVYSVFETENSKLTTFIREDLKLGAEQPFVPDPRKTHTPYVVLVMAIVNWIDFQRLHRWQKSAIHDTVSIYRAIVPDLDTKPFCAKHILSWQKVIGFHLDFFQAPRKRRKKVATAHPSLLAEHERREAHNDRLRTEERDANGTVISWSEPAWLTDLCPWAEIIRIPEFREILDSGRDKNVTDEGGLYKRVKHKILETADSLAKARGPSSGSESVPGIIKS
jgi:hypothetical protein